MKSVKMIGFATKFYTLWNVTYETLYVQDSYGNYHTSGVRQHNNYIKNISMDRAKVEAVYPNVSIDESLRGATRSFSVDHKKDLPVEYFWFGKYNGQLIEEVLKSDLEYCKWAAKNCYSKATVDYIENHPIYVEHLAQEQREKDELLNSIIDLTPGDKVSVTFTRNGYNYDPESGEHGCWVNGWIGDIPCKVYFADCKPVYGMYPYIMPVVNGKAQRVKNKTLEVVVESALKRPLDEYRTYEYRDVEAQAIYIIKTK